MIEDVKPVSFKDILCTLYDGMLNAPIVETGEWQGQVRSTPHTLTAEMEDVTFAYAIPATQMELIGEIRPSMPWAEDHFLERVSGVPWNPPPSSAHWPFAVKQHAGHVDAEAKFSHTYPERMWPTRIEPPVGSGIRFRYGDLNDVRDMLRFRRYTRQAYLPIWFPEDTGANQNQRVPCTLGYHFMIRDLDGEPRLKIVYYMRSCDLYRHFKDDVYMAARLAQWMSSAVGVKPRQLLMHISSLHVFKHDLPIIKTLRDRLEHE